MVLRKNIKILLIDDNEEDILKTCEVLMSNGYEMPIIVKNEKEFNVICDSENHIDVILCEHEIWDTTSLQIFNLAKQKCPNIVFILLSNKISDEFGVELIKEGIDIYFLKSTMLKMPYVIEQFCVGRKIIREVELLKETNDKLKQAYRDIEVKNENIIQSIIFAKRIQSLMLPKIDLLLKNFDEAFILYKPKDIVSGDFYWFNKCYHHNRFAIAVGDCTGHGVSGALLSMIGYNLLNEIINDEDHHDSPTEILRELDNNIVKFLKQDVTNGYQDGIDMSFINIDQENKKIYFCGCKRPLLYLVRDEKEIKIYKGEQYIIGGTDSIIEKTFRTQEIEYKTGDVIYMLTDGYPDQFGGERNKKFMKNRFTQTLLDIQHLPLNYQSQLLEQKLIKWRGENEQTDDILVVGIKL